MEAGHSSTFHRHLGARGNEGTLFQPSGLRLQLSQPWRREEENRRRTRPTMWWHSPSFWSLGFAGVVLSQVLYPALHRCFRKAICLQVCHTPHLQLMPTLAASTDLHHCKQESVEKCPSGCQVAKSPGERGCQSALSFLTPLNSPLPQSCARWGCSKMFPSTVFNSRWWHSQSYTYLSARGNQRSLHFQLISK